MKKKKINSLIELLIETAAQKKSNQEIKREIASFIRDTQSGFHHTDVVWAVALLNSLRDDPNCNLLKIMMIEINDYLQECKQENPDMFYLIAGLYDEAAEREPRNLISQKSAFKRNRVGQSRSFLK